MLSVANKPIMLSVVMLSVVMLSVSMQSVVMLSVIMLSVLEPLLYSMYTFLSLHSMEQQI
jgi:hypothetical protein